MNNLQRQPSPVSHALRMGDADSFIMDSEFFQPVLRASQTPPRDHHPLRRRLHRAHHAGHPQAVPQHQLQRG